MKYLISNYKMFKDNRVYPSYILTQNNGDYIHFLIGGRKDFVEVYEEEDWQDVEDMGFIDDYGTHNNLITVQPKEIIKDFFKRVKNELR